MEAILQAVICRAPLYHQSVAGSTEQPKAGYRYMLVADVYDTLLPIFGSAMTHCPTLTDATQMTAGVLYHEVYIGLTGRVPRPRDCATLERAEQELLAP